MVVIVKTDVGNFKFQTERKIIMQYLVLKPLTTIESKLLKNENLIIGHPSHRLRADSFFS